MRLIRSLLVVAGSLDTTRRFAVEEATGTSCHPATGVEGQYLA